MASFFASKPDPAAIARLAELERIVETGLQAFHKAGLALETIRDQLLYKFKWASFEQYCEQRWSMSREHAHRLMQAAHVCRNLAGLEPLPANEAQARVLAPLPPEQQRQVWEQAKEALPIGNITADQLEEIRDQVAPSRKKSRRKKPKAITLKGKGWKLVLTRRAAELDPVAILEEARQQLEVKHAAKREAA